MDKPTTTRPSDSAICVRPDGSEALVVPSNRHPRDGEWHPEHAALQQAAGDWGALVDFYREQRKIGIEILRYERQYQETGEAKIPFADAVNLAKRIKNLRLLEPFDGRADSIELNAGRCLILKKGQAAGEVYTACARLEVVNIPQWRGAWWDVTLAIPDALQAAGPDATFGAQTVQWLRERCEPLARELAIRGVPPDSPAARMFDGGGFGLTFTVGKTEPEPAPDAVPVVPAPDEATIAQYIEHAASCPDHWDALEYAVKVLRQFGQPLGDALTGWLVERSGRPDGRKAAKLPANTLRNHAIIEAVRALERCGIPPTRNRDKRWLARAHGWEGEIDSDYNPPSGCAIVADAFGNGLTERAVAAIWEKRSG